MYLSSLIQSEVMCLSLAVAACYRYCSKCSKSHGEHGFLHESVLPHTLQTPLASSSWMNKQRAEKAGGPSRTNMGLLSWTVSLTFLVGTFMRSLESPPSSFTLSLFRAGSNTKEVERDSPLSAFIMACSSPWQLLLVEIRGAPTLQIRGTGYRQGNAPLVFTREVIAGNACEGANAVWTAAEHSCPGRDVLSLPYVLKRQRRKKVLANGHISVC